MFFHFQCLKRTCQCGRHFNRLKDRNNLLAKEILLSQLPECQQLIQSSTQIKDNTLFSLPIFPHQCSL